MKLAHFNAETLPRQIGGGTPKQPRVSFNKAGTIMFNGAASSLLELKPGDKITLAQDEEDTANWYFFKHEKGFKLRDGYDKKGCLFNHSVMVKKVISSFKLKEDQTYSFLIAGQPTMIKGDKTKYWGILVTPTV